MNSEIYNGSVISLMAKGVVQFSSHSSLFVNIINMY